MKGKLAQCFSAGAVCAAAIIFIAGCGGGSSNHGLTNRLYIQTNDPASGQNAVIAYRRNSATGALTQLGIYNTGGTGLYSTATLGPDDHDQEIVASPGRGFLFVANQGSNDISSFRINADGTLTLIGSPVSSGGTQPVALAVVGSRLYVANRGDVSTSSAGTVAGNYTGFTIGSGGSLSPIAGSTVTLTNNSSPSQLSVVLNGSVLFGNEFDFTDGAGLIDTLKVNSDGTLSIAGTASVDMTTYPSLTPLTLGLMPHPTQKILYTGLPVDGMVGAWTYDSAGTLTFAGPEQSSSLPAEPALCWIALDPHAKFMYTSSVGPDIVGVLSIDQSDATKVTRIQNYTIPDPDSGTSSPFDLEVASSGKFLYTLNNCNNGTSCTNPTIHVMAIASDGTVNQTSDMPVTVSGAPTFHATGMVVF